jgi:hypothetical protein
MALTNDLKELLLIFLMELRIIFLNNNFFNWKILIFPLNWKEFQLYNEQNKPEERYPRKNQYPEIDEQY